MRKLLVAALIALVCAGAANAQTFSVVQGDAQLPSADTPNLPGDVVFPADMMQPPANPPAIGYDQLLALWQQAGTHYGIPWEVLAAINEVESGFGADMGPSSANAIGWMQFLPSTWEEWGVDGDGDGIADPWNPTDAVYSAARYLAAAGGTTDIYQAVFSYNHAQWYVDRVMGLAGEFLADPFRGESLLSNPDAATFDGPSLQERLDQARTQLAKLQQQSSDLQTSLDQRAQTLQQVTLASGDPSLSDSRFHELRRQVSDLSADQIDTQAKLAQIGDQIETTQGDIQVLEQDALLSQQTVLAGGLEGLIGKPPTPQAAAIIDYASRQLGVPYHWGGNHGFDLQQMETTNPDLANGFDCSSLIAWAYAKGAGIYVGDFTGSQWDNGATALGATRGLGPAQGGAPPPGGYMPGDLLFFNNTDHVGMYLGNDLFVHAPHTGDVVRIARLSQYPLQVWGWVRYQQVSGIPFVPGTVQAATPTSGPTFTVVSETSQTVDPVITFTR